MVVVEKDTGGNGVHIQARANFSLSGSGLTRILISLAGVTLGFATLLAFLGYWPILAFAAIQTAVVSWVLWHAWSGGWVVEDIHIRPGCLAVDRHRAKGSQHLELDTAWAKVQFGSSTAETETSKLVIRSREQSIELGAFLTQIEKQQLAEFLRRELTGLTAWH